MCSVRVCQRIFKPAELPRLHAGGRMATMALGQINLGHESSQSVCEWKSVPTVIETVLVETQVGHGIATTVMTLVFEPGSYAGYKTVLTGDTICKDTRDSGSSYAETERVRRSGLPIDSIEIACHFMLPTDFVAQELWLWVGEEKVQGEIQDRALARGQYEEIVNRRRDPALLEFWGNGSYKLRIFPADSYTARKIAIQWQHTFDDDSLDLITASVPLTLDGMVATAAALAAAPYSRTVLDSTVPVAGDVVSTHHLFGLWADGCVPSCRGSHAIEPHPIHYITASCRAYGRSARVSRRGDLLP
ncbi:MAG: hypothetical protein GF344_13420 [Chitinivibrionales bacterium]|nr:hypothetical protein [Chitinivibrionales bacterium]MBD3357730.1 hypothetical protein [Chitinivibrionales bacterium]